MSNQEHKTYDMIVIGGGPGGYTAALYAARAGLSVLLIEKLAAGGQMALTDMIDNYPGFEGGIDGFSLADKMKKQAERFGAETLSDEVQKVDLHAAVKAVTAYSGTYYAKTVVLAMGANPRPLGLANEQMLIGRGVSYCATCDGMFYRGKTTVVVGGGNTAVEDALVLSRVCSHVYLVHRRDTLRATKIYHDAIQKAENITFCPDSVVDELLAEGKVTGVRLRNVKTDDVRDLSCDGVFVSIGRIPASELVEGQLSLDDGGYIVADESTRTSISGVFAIGDVRTKAVRQVVTATADGAVAVHYAEEYLTEYSAS